MERRRAEKEGLNFARQIKCAVSRQWLSHRPKTHRGSERDVLRGHPCEPWSYLEGEPTYPSRLRSEECNVSRDISPFLIFPRGDVAVSLSSDRFFWGGRRRRERIRFDYRDAIKGTWMRETGKQGFRLGVYRSKAFPGEYSKNSIS